MKHTSRNHQHRSADPGTSLTIRAAMPADSAALTRLAQRDSARAPHASEMLLAEVDGDLRAAVPLHGGEAIADPFHPTSELVRILQARARQLAEADSRRAPLRTRRVAALRPRAAGGDPVPE
jgi:hypothetical protein